LEIHPCYMYLAGRFHDTGYQPWLILEVCLMIALQLSTNYFPMRYGLNRWKQMEF
jgi:hypothetical protein